MKSTETYAKFGGKAAFDKILNAIKAKYGLAELGTEPCDTDEPDSPAMVLFGYASDDETADKAYEDFCSARDEIAAILSKLDLYLSYECNGDGDNCILMQYRIV